MSPGELGRVLVIDLIRPNQLPEAVQTRKARFKQRREKQVIIRDG